jgi:hypothetical protein
MIVSAAWQASTAPCRTSTANACAIPRLAGNTWSPATELPRLQVQQGAEVRLRVAAQGVPQVRQGRQVQGSRQVSPSHAIFRRWLPVLLKWTWTVDITERGLRLLSMVAS